MLLYLKTGEIFHKLLRKLDHLIQVQVFSTLKVKQIGRKMFTSI